MNKLWLIIKREYSTRVRKKSFILVTLLVPVLLVLLMGLPTLIAQNSRNDVESCNVKVLDQTSKYASRLNDNENVKYVIAEGAMLEDSLKAKYKEDGFDAYMVITDDLIAQNEIRLCSHTSLPLAVMREIGNNMSSLLRDDMKHDIEGYDARLDSLLQKIQSVKCNVSQEKISSKSGEISKNDAFTNVGLAIGMAMIIYMVVLIYGSIVMQSVMEERSSRIVEVIISSVSPFYLMMGKILGVVLVSLTQIGIWIGIGIAFFVSAMAAGGPMLELISSSLPSDWLQMLLLFITFFVGGYLLYASMFAAIGALCDTTADGQQFMTIVMIPIVASIMIAIEVVNNPMSSLAEFGSIFPFTSPVVMLARYQFMVPTWQIIVSILLLFATVVFTIWLSSRIYRTGILMYGKKITFKEIVRWFRESGC